jgi:DNA-binding CsgD family transcriptional regulator/PAS domain-containing protein
MDDLFNIQLSKFMFQHNKDVFFELSNNTNRMVLVLNKNGRIQNYNQHTATFHAWEVNLSIIGQNYGLLCEQFQIDISSLLDKLPSVFKGLVIDGLEISVNRNNKASYLQMSAISLDEDTALIVARDITLIKAKEITNKALASYLPSALKFLPVNFFWKDTSSAYMGADEGFLKICGLSSLTEIRGLTDYDCPWKKEETLKFIREDKLVYITGQPRFNIIEETTFADKKTYQVLVSKVPLFDDNNEVIGEMGIFSKLTDAAQNKLAFFMANDVLQESIIPQNRKYCLPHPYDDEGEIYLTSREKQCLDQYVAGKTSKEVARHLGISYKTVEIHINNIRQKLNLYTRSAITNFYLDYQGFWINHNKLIKDGTISTK